MLDQEQNTNVNQTPPAAPPVVYDADAVQKFTFEEVHKDKKGRSKRYKVD